MSDAWYVDPDEYWVEPGEADDYPLRQGDLLAGPQIQKLGWDAAQLVHPTCELAKANVSEVQVVRVRRLGDLADDSSKALVVCGYQERDGRREVAVAHTFFLAPPPGAEEPLFSNFREIATLPRDAVTQDARICAMTHDCRVSFIRRWLYFRFRLVFEMSAVRGWEATRIGRDPRFEGPKPDWALPV